MRAHDELLAFAKEHNRELYDRVMMEQYIEDFGYHYNEQMARDAVAHMRHDGEVGEHWTCDQVVSAIAPYIGTMEADDTTWDAYVICNAWWHDLGENYKKRGEENAIIEDAMTWAFADDDAPDGKVWRYMHAMR